MSEVVAGDFLAALRHSASSSKLYPPDHPNALESVARLVASATRLVEGNDKVAISAIDGSFYLDRVLLPTVTLEHRTLAAAFTERGLESVTITARPTEGDLLDLSLFLGSGSEDLPIEGTVVLNERPYTRSEVYQAARLSGLRKSYANSIDLLRGMSVALETGEPVDVGSSVWSVQELLEGVMSRRGASLLLSTLKTHDQYTFFHSVNTAILALAFGRSVGFDETDLVQLGVGALLHDIGKVKVPQEIIQYPGRLDDDQWAEIKLHPQEGAHAILAGTGAGNETAALVALEHHARYDMTGYPAISYHGRPHIFSRIVSVCDVYDALTTRRSYKRAEAPPRALEMIVEWSGAQLDPDVVEAFVAMMGVYPTGSIVRLVDGRTMIVVDPQDGVTALAAELDVSARPAVIAGAPTEFDTMTVDELVLPDTIGVVPASLLEGIDRFDQAA